MSVKFTGVYLQVSISPAITDKLQNIIHTVLVSYRNGKGNVLSVNGDKAIIGRGFFNSSFSLDDQKTIFDIGKSGLREFLDKLKPPKQEKRLSRSARFQSIINCIGEGRTEAEELKEELENWRDNLPENLQSGNKAEELDVAIIELEDFISDCDTAEAHDVSFPSMFGG